MNKLTVYNLEGKESGSANLPKELVTEVNKALLGQAIHIYRDRQHPGNARVKTRAEVNITKKKIYKQKGTGGARHGASSAPIFVGGGVTHGPKGIKRELILPQAMRQKALQVALSVKASEGKVVGVSGLENVVKTREVKDLLKSLKTTGNHKITLVLKEYKEEAFRALRNLENVEVLAFSDLNAYQVFFGGLIVLDEAVLESSKVTVKKPAAKARKVVKK